MTTRKPLISGNWKMNYTHLDAIAVVQKLTYTSCRPTTTAPTFRSPQLHRLRSVQTMLDADGIPIALGRRTSTRPSRVPSRARSARPCWPSSTSVTSSSALRAP